LHVFDSRSFIVIGHYYPDRFPTFWRRFDRAVEEGEVISVREVYGEVSTEAAKPRLLEWAKTHREIFAVPTDEETAFVAAVFQIPPLQSADHPKAATSR
jgi:Domain of unknown function (DUF4411)